MSKNLLHEFDYIESIIEKETEKETKLRLIKENKRLLQTKTNKKRKSKHVDKEIDIQ